MNPTKTSRGALVTTTLALAAGLTANAIAWAGHVGLDGLVAATCGIGDCHAASAGPYAVFPPEVAPLDGSLPRIPTAALGFAWFASLAISALLRRGLPLALVATGALASLGYLLLGTVALGQTCSLCLTSHAAAFVVLAAALTDHPRRARSPESAALGLAGTAAVSLVVLLTTPSTAALLEAWRNAPLHSPGQERIVVFTDPTCPSCQAFEHFARTRLSKLPDPPTIRTRVLGPSATGESAARDRSAAAAFDIDRVPTVYLDSRRVPFRAHRRLDFWREALRSGR